MKEKGTAKKLERTKGSSRIQTIIMFVILAILILAFILLWMRSIANGYFGSYIQRNDQIDSVMELNSGLQYSRSEKDSLVPLETAWDAFCNSHLRDQITVTALDGAELNGYLYNQKGDRTILVLPQYNHTGTDDFLYGSFFAEQGFNLLLADSRAHGLSGGNYCGFGWLEQNDVTVWLDWINTELQSEHIIIYGAGMGANAALLWASQMQPDYNVDFIIAESPYDSLLKEAQYTLKNTHSLPWGPFGVALQWKVEHEQIGYTAGDAVLTEETLGGADIPVLFLLAAKDDYIPAEYSLFVYDAYPGEKELYEAPCRHGLIFSTGQDDIQTQFSNWLSAYSS